jgi:2-aminoethylphosphonate-pyruvate transaminase
MDKSAPSVKSSRDKLLFTPGPLTTSQSVKQAMLHDAGSWHFEFNMVVREIRQKLLALAGLAPADGYEVVLMQGSGTFGVESVLGSVIPPQGKLLVLANGAYGERLAQMAACLRIEHQVLRSAENAAPSPSQVEELLSRDSRFTHVAVVHCETTTGLLNPIKEIGEVVCRRGLRYIVDAMSSFGGIPIDLKASGIDYLISSANKCVEGVPGFSFIFARRADLLQTEGSARSLSLDLLAQLKGFEKNGQFRYTPPTHAILAFRQALAELELEGGIAARAYRYAANHRCLLAGMKQLGLEAYLPPHLQSYIITAFPYPKKKAFHFQTFYERLSDLGFIIYPGKLTAVDTFRIGTIGRIFETDMDQLVHAISKVMETFQESAAQ